MLTNGDSSSGAADREAGSPQRHKPTSRRGETSPGAEPAGSCWHRTTAPFEAAALWIQQCLAPRDLTATPRMLRRRGGQMGPDQYEYEQRCLRRVRLLLLVAAVMAAAGAATSMAIPYVPGALFFVGMTVPLLLILRASASREDDRLPTGSEDEVSPERLLWATRACLFLPLVVLIDYVVRAESVDVDSVTEKDGWLETEVETFDSGPHADLDHIWIRLSMGADLALICALILLAEACHSLRRARFGYDDDSDYSPSRSDCSMSSMDAAFSRSAAGRLRGMWRLSSVEAFDDYLSHPPGEAGRPTGGTHSRDAPRHDNHGTPESHGQGRALPPPHRHTGRRRGGGVSLLFSGRGAGNGRTSHGAGGEHGFTPTLV